MWCVQLVTLVNLFVCIRSTKKLQCGIPEFLSILTAFLSMSIAVAFLVLLILSQILSPYILCVFLFSFHFLLHSFAILTDSSVRK